MDDKSHKHKEDKMDVAKVNLVIDYPAVEKSITEFLAMEFEKRDKRIAILGLSGGIDSALVAFLCEKAGLELFAIMMPYGADKEATNSQEDAMRVCDALRIPSYMRLTVDISPAASAADKAMWASYGNLPLPFLHKKVDLDLIALGNNKARQRMIVLYDLARRLRGLVVGTENRSEYYLGYFTLYGDQAADINPIAGLWKTQVRALAKYVGVPQEILAKAPSAGLWPGQTDEGELGFTYDEADRVLASLEEKYYGQWPDDFYDKPASIMESLVERVCRRSAADRETVLKVLEAVKQTEYKRRTPPAWSLH